MAQRSVSMEHLLSKLLTIMGVQDEDGLIDQGVYGDTEGGPPVGNRLLASAGVT